MKQIKIDNEILEETKKKLNFKNKFHFYKYMLKTPDTKALSREELRTAYGAIKGISKKSLNTKKEYIVEGLSNLVHFGFSPVLRKRHEVNKNYALKVLNSLTSFLTLKPKVTNKKLGRRLKTKEDIIKDLDVYFDTQKCPLSRKEIVEYIEQY